MTVVISINLSDGAILAADSAVTGPNPFANAPKFMEQAEKLFQIENRPSGAATYGLRRLGHRTIGSYLREFQVREEEAIRDAEGVGDIVELLRRFFEPLYRRHVIDAVNATGTKFEEVPYLRQLTFGLAVAGFSQQEYLSEVWELSFSGEERPGKSECLRAPGSFGDNWFGSWVPIHRYMSGYDPNVVDALVDLMVKLKDGVANPGDHAQTQQERLDIRRAVEKVLGSAAHPAPFDVMPMGEGVDYARFLVQLVINYFRFGYDIPAVGGKVQVGMVTYHASQFRMLE